MFVDKSYEMKYLKYKNKYLQLKKQLGGNPIPANITTDELQELLLNFANGGFDYIDNYIQIGPNSFIQQYINVKGMSGMVGGYLQKLKESIEQLIRTEQLHLLTPDMKTSLILQANPINVEVSPTGRVSRSHGATVTPTISLANATKAELKHILHLHPPVELNGENVTWEKIDNFVDTNTLNVVKQLICRINTNYRM